MSWLRGRPTNTAAAAVLVLAVGFGLLAMHMLVMPSSASTMVDATATGPAMSGHGAHTAAAAARAGAPSMIESRIGAVTHAMTGHDHGLMGCLWFIATGIGLAIFAVAQRLRCQLPATWGGLRSALRGRQRASPVAVRLSLVGVSLR